MADDPAITQLLPYLPPDRADALLKDQALPEKMSGAVLFSDISGFTPLTEAVIARYGPRIGGEHFTDRLNAVYDALIAEVERYGGSIVGFAGDAMIVWLRGDAGVRAATLAVRMQAAMRQFASVGLPGGETVSLGMKVAIAAGIVRRFAAGDPRIQVLDVMAGAVMERVSACEGVARRGEIVMEAETARRLADRIVVAEWRRLNADDGDAAVAVIAGLAAKSRPVPRRPAPLPAGMAERLRPWLVPEVARRLVTGQDVFLTELRPATALFAHFDGIDYESDPAAPTKLDAYIRWLQTVLAQLEGVLVQLTIGEKGSYFYAAWGAPVAHDDDTMRACTAALEIVNPPREIAAFIRATHVGIACGTMRAGAYGNAHRRTYGVLGDDTNLAARLMTKAAANQILITAQAARRQSDAFELQPLPALTVKGKKEPVPVYRLVARKAATAGGGAARSATRMVGRARERGSALERLALARAGRGQVIAVTGEAGMGKTRLVAEVVSEAARLGFAVFAGDCPVLAREASYSVWVPICRRMFQFEPDPDPGTALAHIEHQLAAAGASLVPRAPLIGSLINLELPANELTRTLEAKVRRASLEGLAVEWIRHRAKATPLLLVLENCHWIDEASGSLLSAIARASPRLPVAVVLAHRPMPGGVPGLAEAAAGRLVTISLGDLPTEEARQLVEQRLAAEFGADDFGAALVDRITAHAAGNPFFIEEVVALLKARGVAPRGDGGAFELPDTLHSLVLGRIDQLTEDAQTTLKVASVIGRLFRTAMLFGVHPLERMRPEVATHLAELHRRDLALPEPAVGEPAYLFKHVVTQEVAYESLPYSFRAIIHEAVGDYLERVAGDNVRPWLDLLAFHYDRSKRDDKKRQYLVAAGEAAHGAYALPSAISYYERALALVADAARIGVLRRLGEVLELVGRWNDAFARYREARALAESIGAAAQRAAVAAAIGDLHRKRGEFVEAEQWLQRARVENAELRNESAVALTLHLEATLCAQTGNFRRATELYLDALAMRERLRDEPAMAKTLNNLGIVARSQGDIETALRYHERSLAIRRRVNDRREIANSLNNLGFIHRFRRAFDQARALLEESVQMNRAVGDRWSTANALTSLAELALDVGDAALAGRCLQESITINRDLGDRRALAFLLEGFGRLGRLRQQPADALRFFSAARQLRATMGAPLEPADAAQLATTVAEAQRGVPEAEWRQIEAEAAATPLDEILDRAVASVS